MRTSATNIHIDHFKTTLHILNALPTYRDIHFETTFMCSRSCWSAFEPGASGLPYYCTLLVCVPDVIGTLTVWRHYNKQNKWTDACCVAANPMEIQTKKVQTGQSTVEPYDFTPLVCTPAVNRGLALWRHNKPINKKTKRKI